MGFTNFIYQIKDTSNTAHNLVDTSASHYVKGTQTSSTNVWAGALPDGVTAYYDGLTIDYFLPYAGTSTAATLNLGGLGAKPVYIGEASSTAVTTHYPQYSVLHMTYVVNSALNSGNGCWKVTGYRNSTYYVTDVTCGTAAATAAKVGSTSYYTLAQNQHFNCMFVYDNSYAGALTLNINSAGAKPIYINGQPSSASNYTLPKGMYFVYYDGTNYYFNTNGTIVDKTTNIDNKVSLQYNSTTESLDFVFI